MSGSRTSSGKSNVLLVFHPFAFTPVCAEEARDLQENLAVVPQREHGDRLRLVRHVGGAAGLEARARRRVHVRVGLLAARRDGKALRRLQRGERRPDPRDVPDRQGRSRDLVARQGHGHAPDRDGPRVARDAGTRRSVRRAPAGEARVIGARAVTVGGTTGAGVTRRALREVPTRASSRTEPVPPPARSRHEDSALSSRIPRYRDFRGARSPWGARTGAAHGDVVAGADTGPLARPAWTNEAQRARPGRPPAPVTRLHVHAWGDEGAPAVVCLHGVTGWGGHFAGLASNARGQASRAGARPARSRQLPEGAALASRRPPRRRRAYGRRRADLARPLVRRTARLRARRPSSRLRRAARAARPGDPAPAARRPLGGRERPRRAGVRLVRGCGRPPLRGEPAPCARRASWWRASSALTWSRRTARGATATRRRASSPPTAEMATAPPPFDAVRVPTLLVLGADSYLPYDHLLDAHRAALGDLLEVVTVPGGHTVLWDALEETADAVARFLAGGSRLTAPPTSVPRATRRTRPRSRAPRRGSRRPPRPPRG